MQAGNVGGCQGPARLPSLVARDRARLSTAPSALPSRRRRRSSWPAPPQPR